MTLNRISRVENGWMRFYSLPFPLHIYSTPTLSFPVILCQFSLQDLCYTPLFSCSAPLHAILSGRLSNRGRSKLRDLFLSFHPVSARLPYGAQLSHRVLIDISYMKSLHILLSILISMRCQALIFLTIFFSTSI